MKRSLREERGRLRPQLLVESFWNGGNGTASEQPVNQSVVDVAVVVVNQGERR